MPLHISEHKNHIGPRSMAFFFNFIWLKSCTDFYNNYKTVTKPIKLRLNVNGYILVEQALSTSKQWASVRNKFKI